MPPDKWSRAWDSFVLPVTVEFTPFLVRASCGFSGLVQLGRKVARRQVSERRMRPVFIVVGPPVVDLGTGVGHGQEP